MQAGPRFLLSLVAAVVLCPVVIGSMVIAAPRASAAESCVVEGTDILQARLEPCGTLAKGAPASVQAITTRITGPQAIKVKWQEPTGKPAKLYAVYAFTGNDGTLVCKVKRLRCTATALDVDMEYTFYVVASNKAGSSAAAASASVYLPADASPDGFR